MFTKETKTLGSWVETSNDKVTVIEYGPRRVTYEFGDCAVAAKAIDPQNQNLHRATTSSNNKRPDGRTSEKLARTE